MRGRLLQNAMLADYTSWRVGGPAETLYIPADLKDLSDYLQKLPEEFPILWLGLGSNVLIRDGGVSGVVIITQGALHEMGRVAENLIRVEAGIACAQAARFSARLGLTGIEFLAGIPGTIGGALKMNAGCYGGETWQYVHAVETINRKGEIKTRQAEEYQYSYRQVIGHQDEWFVAGHFKLAPGDKDNSLAMIRELLEKRNAAQPTGLPNCGSVFRNPPGNYAARLIEECGLKGKKTGGASVSTKHANFIINEGNATAADIETLIADVCDTVQKQTGVRLVREVCIIGKD